MKKMRPLLWALQGDELAAEMSDKAGKTTGGDKAGKAADRQARLAEALRANLKKRKARAQKPRPAAGNDKDG